MNIGSGEKYQIWVVNFLIHYNKTLCFCYIISKRTSSFRSTSIVLSLCLHSPNLSWVPKWTKGTLGHEILVISLYFQTVGIYILTFLGGDELTCHLWLTWYINVLFCFIRGYGPSDDKRPHGPFRTINSFISSIFYSWSTKCLSWLFTHDKLSILHDFLLIWETCYHEFCQK